MGGLVRGFKWWWDYFYENFYVIGPHVKGYIVLPYGNQQVTISTTPGKVDQVYLHVDPGSGVPVCAGDVNYVGCTNTENDFTIYAQVNSNTAKVYWIVIFKPQEIDPNALAHKE